MPDKEKKQEVIGSEAKQRMVFDRLWKHHNALWEEEKHYSWWIYIILAGIIFIALSDASWLIKIVLVFLGSLLGLFISVVGYLVIKRESQRFDVAMIELKKIEDVPEYDKDTFTGIYKIGIREWFRYTFVAFAILFLLSIIIELCLVAMVLLRISIR
jgi:hypothetical protein